MPVLDRDVQNVHRPVPVIHDVGVALQGRGSYLTSKAPVQPRVGADQGNLISHRIDKSIPQARLLLFVCGGRARDLVFSLLQVDDGIAPCFPRIRSQTCSEVRTVVGFASCAASRRSSSAASSSSGSGCQPASIMSSQRRWANSSRA